MRTQALSIIRWFPLMILLIVFSRCASKKKALNTTLMQTAKNLERVYTSKNRPWPHYNLLNYPILFISFKEKVVKRFVKSELQDLNFSQWENVIPKTRVGFDTLKVRNTKYLILNLDNFQNLSPIKLMATAIHEGFHYFGQSEWKKQRQEKGRGNIYPLQSVPRYYRWEMRESLLNYLKTKNPNSLRHYSYWYYKWKTNFKEEYENYTDRIEGTAQYYTNVLMTIFGNTSDEASVSEFEVFQKNLATNQPFQKMFSLSYESYVLGTLSGILLNQEGPAGWQRTSMLGLSPLELLARRHKPLRESVDNKVQTEFLKASVREMMKIDKDGQLDKLISALANSKVVKAVIPSEGLQFSSFSTKGVYRSFFNYPGVKNVEMIRLASTHKITGPKLDLTFIPGDFWVTAQQTPCSMSHSTILLFDKTNLVLQKTLLQVKANSLAFQGQLKNYQSTPWFCVTQQIKK